MVHLISSNNSPCRTTLTKVEYCYCRSMRMLGFFRLLSPLRCGYYWMMLQPVRCVEQIGETDCIVNKGTALVPSISIDLPVTNRHSTKQWHTSPLQTKTWNPVQQAHHPWYSDRHNAVSWVPRPRPERTRSTRRLGCDLVRMRQHCST